MMKNKFELFIRRYCHQHKTSIEKLADAAGISRGTFYNLLKSDNPRLNQLIALAHVMGVHHNMLIQLKWADSYPELASSAVMSDDASLDASGFVDETLPDGSIVAIGSEFEKTWVIQNIGEQVWQDRKLVCMDEFGAAIPANMPKGLRYQLVPKQLHIDIPTTPPWETVALSMGFTAPSVAGRYVSYWKMVDANHNICFPQSVGLFLCVSVKSLGICC